MDHSTHGGVYVPNAARDYPHLVDQPTIKFRIGPERKVFHIPRVKLINQSPYFNSHLAKGVKSINLPNTTSETFHEFAYWLYHGHLEAKDHRLIDCICLIKFGPMVQVDEFANLTMDILRAYILAGQMFTIEQAQILYANTTDVKLRVLFCFGLVLQARHNHSRMGNLTDASLDDLLELGGKLATDFPKLMAHCTKNRITWTPHDTRDLD
ncbi:MAG: hypothetical protein Q9221_006883 [Calogaya cf. arnoldii]